MSATNRGSKRVPFDFYATPPHATQALRKWLEQKQVRIETVLDPAAGEGALLREFSAYTYAYEVREECRDALDATASVVSICDALPCESDPGDYDLVVCNPPFSLAREFVTAYRYVGKTSAFLLRLAFLGAQSRFRWWTEDPPSDVLVLTKRPSFKLNGKTDAAEYAWFVWRGRTPNGYTRLDWLT